MGVLNRRKLIQLLLLELPTERSYFDFKRSIDFATEPGRGRLVQDIAALANSNCETSAFVIVGVDDVTHDLVYAGRIDGVRLQQLVREYISPE